MQPANYVTEQLNKEVHVSYKATIRTSDELTE